jgi:hypothetical protein
MQLLNMGQNASHEIAHIYIYIYIYIINI